MPNTVQDSSTPSDAKAAARQCLLAADKFLKDSDFDRAREELDKAKGLDPSNPYIYAFQDRIAYFEEQKKKGPVARPGMPPVSEQLPSRPPPSPEPHQGSAQAKPDSGTSRPVEPMTPRKQETSVAHPSKKGMAPPVAHQQKARPEARPAGASGVSTAPVVPGSGAALEGELAEKNGEARTLEDQRRREAEARAAAEEQRRRELEVRVAAEEQRRRELEARVAAEEEKRREAEAWAIEERRRKELEAKATAEERLRRELEERVLKEERKRKELEQRVAAAEKMRKEVEAREAEDQKRRELEARAAAEEQKRRELEARVAAEEQRRRELEARLATEEQKRREEELRQQEERKRRELEELAQLEERKRRELEMLAGEEERKRRELEAWAYAEEQKRKELEARVAEEERKRRELEEKAALEEQKRRELELRVAEQQRRKEIEVMAAEERRRREAEAHAAEQEKRKEAEARALEEQRKLVEMRRQVEELTAALEQEKKAREEITKRNLQNAVKQFRVALEVAWVNGAPGEKAADSLRQLALSLNIPTEVEQSVQREVKLEMYSRAVKEVIAKRKLLRSSSSTLEWLRKVYQVSVAEYLENESNFLLDLLADQYRGTILLVSTMIGTGEDLVHRLKSSGYAVVHASTPEQALEKIEKINPNLILCDVEFPHGGLSGLKFLHILRITSKFNFIPFILLSNPAEVQQLQSSELRPNEGYIQTPVDYEKLTTLMNEKLAQFREYISSLG